MDYTSLSVEVLFAELLKYPSDSPVLEELAQRMRPIIMTEALKYLRNAQVNLRYTQIITGFHDLKQETLVSESCLVSFQ